MEATEVDWSMGSQASRLADWDAALSVGRRVAGPGVPVVAADRARMREDFAELVPSSEERIRDFTSLDPGGFRSRPWVMARSEWIRANLRGLQRMLEPLAGRILARQPAGRGTLRRKGMGALTLFLTPEQRSIVRHVQGVMSLLEGHASYVMNEVADGHVGDLARMRRALAERRRRAGGIERSFQRAIGFDKKIEQYDAGERFVREVISRVGM